jgi:hypothetical protein
MTSAMPSLDRLGLHPVDGAHFLRAHGQERLACLVAYYSGARFEAEERGLVDKLAAVCRREADGLGCPGVRRAGSYWPLGFPCIPGPFARRPRSKC